MTWTDLVAGCFGFGTAPFASNPQDEEIARQTIAAAKAEGATRQEFARLIETYPRKYIKSDQVLRQRLREDAARLEKLWATPRVPE